MRISLWTIVALFLLGCSASSSDGEGDATTAGGDSGASIEKEALPVVIQMDGYSQADFLSRVEADPDLQALWAVLQGEGYTSFVAAGLTSQADGLEVLWGEADSGGGLLKGLVRHCVSSDNCVRAIWGYNGGLLAFRDVSGGDIEMPGVGLPVLLKQLEGHTYDKPTHVIEAALEPGEEMPQIDVSRRRFYVVSSFGPLWANGSLATDVVKSHASASGAFDDVIAHDYVRAEKVDDILLHSHPYDVFVWLGQTVREEAKTGEIWKPIGMTVNAGLFGDALYDRGRLEDRIVLNPVHGPGLMVLAGCETMGDGNGGWEQDNSIPLTLDNKVRTLVGFRRCGDARDVLHATELFLEAYFSGATLGASLDTANGYLASQEGELTMETLPDADLAGLFLPQIDQYWEWFTDDGTPGDSFITANINITNMCTAHDGSTYQEDGSFAQAWSKEITWIGPFFSGTRKNPDNKVDFSITGALMRIGEGAHFFFLVQGSLSPKVQGLTLYADAVIDKIVLDKEKLDEFILEFKGQGKASTYVNEAGDKCQMQDPFLVSTLGEPSKFKIPVTWKVGEEDR
jgi:hypothetical protein